MFLRIVQRKISAENIFGFRRFYQEQVIPMLEQTPGCQSATLVQSGNDSEEFMSLTLWKEKEVMATYEKSDTYKELVKKMKPMLADSSEWKVQLSEDFTVEYKPVEQEAVVKSYNVVEYDEDGMPMPEPSPQFYMRIVSVRIAEGKDEEFQQLYSSILVPTLMTVPGCQYAFLSQGTPADHEWLSVTIWNSRKDADNYEASGVFDSLTDKVAHTFSSVYQWKMTLEKEYGRKSATTEDLKVDEYAVITGRSFE